MDFVLNTINSKLQLSRIVNKAKVTYNINRVTEITIIDLEKAYDAIWRDGMIQKLYSLRFSTFLIKIILEILNNKQSAVKTANSKLEKKNTNMRSPARRPSIINTF